MKSYTNLEQSKKLAEFLPLESADMSYRPYREEGGIPDYESDLCPYRFASWSGFPCWSLAALISLMPRIEHMKPFIDLSPKLDSEEVAIYYHSEDSPYIVKDNLIDACYDMILKLHEQKLL